MRRRLPHRRGAEEHDVAAAVRAHHRNAVPRQPNRAHQEQVEGLSPLVVAQLFEIAVVDMAGIEDEDVDTSEGFDDSVDEVLQGGGASKIRRHRQHFCPTGVREHFASAGQNILAAGADRNRASGLGEMLRAGEAEAFARSGDERDLSVEANLHCYIGYRGRLMPARALD